MRVQLRALRWLAAVLAVVVAAGCGGSALVGSGPTPTPTPGRSSFIPAGAVLYGSIAGERPGSCYPPEEAARFSLLDLSMHLAARTGRWCGTPDRPLDAIRAFNPNSVILLYRMAASELNWTGGRFPVSGREYFEALRSTHGIGSSDPWFAAGDRTRDYLVDKSYPQYVLMELGNPNWVRYWIEQGYQDMWGPNPVLDARGASGVFVDGATSSPPRRFCPMSGWDAQGGRCTVADDYPDTYWDNGQWRDDLWRQHMFDFVRQATSYHRARGLQTMFNVWMLSDTYRNFLNQVGGHAMEECGFVCAYRGFPPTTDHWLQRLNNLQQATNFAILNTNSLVVPSGSGASRMDQVVWNGLRGWDILWFAMTSFLLGYDPARRNGYFHFTVAGNLGNIYRDTYWFDEYDPRYLHLGLPRGPARQLASGVWEREFDRGWVWVNPSNTDATVTVPSGARARVLNHDTFKNPAAVQPVTQLVLRAWTGVVGLRE